MKPNIQEILMARNSQLMGYQFMSKEQIEKAEKEWEKVKTSYGIC